MATNTNKAIKISQKHLLGIQDLKVPEIKYILNEILDGGPGRTRTTDQWIMRAWID